MDLTLGLAAYRNASEMWRAVGAVAEDDSVFQVLPQPDRLLIRSNISRRVPHMVLDPVVQPAAAPAWATALVEELAGDQVSLMVSLPPGTEQGALARCLEYEGFTPAARPRLAMARATSRRAHSRDDPAIALADQAGELAEARSLLARIFGLPDEVFRFYTPRGIVGTYVLRLDGVIVAAACLCPFAGVAAIYSVGVLPAMRGRGYARRLVEHLVAAAAERGLAQALLYCDRSLLRLYGRLGFALVWEQVDYWLEAWWR